MFCRITNTNYRITDFGRYEKCCCRVHNNSKTFKNQTGNNYNNNINKKYDFGNRYVREVFINNKSGKIAAATSDCAAVSFAFDTKGVSTFDATKAISTKKELGTNYGMAAYGTDLNGDGKVLEWNEQAAAFDAACIGKTAGDVASLMAENGYGVADLQTAGCTMGIGSFVKAAAKIG